MAETNWETGRIALGKYVMEHLEVFPSEYTWDISVMGDGTVGILCIGDNIPNKGVPYSQWTILSGRTDDTEEMAYGSLSRMLSHCVRGQEEMVKKYG